MTLLDALSTHLQPYREYLGLFRYGFKWGAIRYISVVATAFAVLAWCRNRSGWRAPFQSAERRPRRWQKEALFNMSTLIIGSFLGPLFVIIGLSDHTLFYYHVKDYGWPYFFASFGLMLMIRETLNYWFHRWMHHRRVFRFTHLEHHRSIHTTPLSGYSVHPVECFLDAVIPSAAILLLVPVHPIAFGLFWWIDTMWSVMGHTGIEVFPAGTNRHWLGRWLNTPTGHILHHVDPRHNFGFYLLIWDRLCGTVHPEYDQHFEAHAVRPLQVQASAPATRA